MMNDGEFINYENQQTFDIISYSWSSVSLESIILCKPRNTGKRSKICSNLAIKTPERHQWRRFVVFIINFGKYFTHSSCVSFVDFEQVNICWEGYGLQYHQNPTNEIINLKSITKTICMFNGTEAYQRLPQTSKMKICVTIVKDLNPSTIVVKSSILNLFGSHG